MNKNFINIIWAYNQYLTFGSDYSDVRTSQSNALHMIRYRIEWATTWRRYFIDNQLLIRIFIQNIRE